MPALPACFLLQDPLFNQHHPNLVVPCPGNHHNLSYPLPSPILPRPPIPLKVIPQRVPARWRKQLPSVGSRWTASTLPSLLAFLFFPRSCSPGSLSQSVCIFNSTILCCQNLVHVCMCIPWSALTCFPSLNQRPGQLSC